MTMFDFVFFFFFIFHFSLKKELIIHTRINTYTHAYVYDRVETEDCVVCYVGV